MSRSLSQHIADFVTATVVPDRVLYSARLRLLDATGLAIAASGSPAVDAFEKAARLAYGTGTAGVIGGNAKFRLSGAGAAAVNAMRIHALDFDDTYLPGTLHSHVSIIPAALASADVINAPIESVLRATALAAEVICWISEQIGKDMQLNGFHTSAVVGAVGAAISAGLTLNLTAAQLTDAIGLSCMVAAGLWQFEESWAKNWNVAQASSAGFTSAVLASTGFKGPLQGLEGSYGLLMTHGKLPLDWSKWSLGDTWRSPIIAMKAYGACQFMQPIIEAAITAHRAVTPEKIKSVVIDVPDELGIRCIAIPEDERRSPAEAYRARFAGHWLVARALIDGDISLRTFDTITPIPPNVRELAEKVSFRVTPFDEFPARWPSRLHVTTQEQVLSFSVAGEPLSMDAENSAVLLGKCRQNISYGGGDPLLTDRLFDLTGERGADIQEFWKLINNSRGS